MKRLFGRVILAVGGATYHWEDILLAGELRGEWGPVRQRVRQGLACLERARRDEDCLEEEEVEAAANAFRYQRDLETAEQTEEWLDSWGLSIESWMDYIRSSLLRTKWEHELPALVSAHPSDDEAIDSMAETEALCSGDVERLAHDLAGRAAVYEMEQEQTAAEPPAFTATVGCPPLPSSEPLLLGAQLDDAVLRSKMERLARLEATFERFRRRALTAPAIEAWIRVRQSDLTRIDVSRLALPAEDMAREAALAVRADGRPLTEVAEDAKTTLRRHRFFLAELDPSIRDIFWSARPGELIGPLEDEGGFNLYLLHDKTEPSAVDADVVARAGETLLQRLVDREIAGRVEWHVAF